MSRDAAMTLEAMPGGFVLDAFQREALAELGLQPYVHVGSPGASAATGAGAAAVPPALLQALARAAGCDPQTVAALPGLEAACAGAAGKRALWPQLRRLRAARR